MTAVLISVGVFSAQVSFSYDEVLVGLIRQVPGRSWDKASKRWTIPIHSVDFAKSVFELHGHTVVVADQSPNTSGQYRDTAWQENVWAQHEKTQERIQEEARRAQDQSHRERGEQERFRRENERLKREAQARNGAWAEQLLSRCSPELSDKVFRALALVLHPDTGGDSGLMRDLNVARDLMQPSARKR